MRLPHGLRALAHGEYRRFYFAQLVALVGGWMQAVAQAWLVLQLTSSPFKLGLISTLQFSPVLLFAVVTGAVADRLPKRRLLVITQTTLACQALLLGALVATGLVEYWHVAVLGLLLGFANVFDQPARQSYVMDLVGKDDVASAVALNSAAFNAARIVGPAVAGVVIGRFGVVPAFFVNSASFLAVIVTLARLESPGRPAREARASMREEIAEGLRYASRTPRLLLALALVLIVSLCVFNFTVYVPLLFVTGYAGLKLMASCNTSMQLRAPDELRGRVMSLYTWVSGGIFPIGAFLVGTISQWWGVSAAFFWNGALGLAALAGIMLWWRRRHA